MKITAIVVAAGIGARSELGYNKVLYKMGNKTLLETVADVFFDAGVEKIILVINKENEEKIKAIFQGEKRIKLCYGGESRTDSVRNGLNAVGACDIVLIHDGARPFVTKDIIRAAIDCSLKFGSGIAAVRTVDTIKEAAENGEVLKSLNRDVLYNIQTPQAFKYELILKAYNSVSGSFTDDAAVYEACGFTPYLSPGSYRNKKLTTKDDFSVLDAVQDNNNSVVGHGFDVHRLVKDRKLILGGVEIPHDKGLLGHSDADVLTHAIMDAMLSAAALPDIGVLFPDTDNKYKDIYSINLLKEVRTKTRVCGFEIGNISAVIMAEKPKLAPHIPQIRDFLAKTLCISLSQINISATTTEQLGIVGEEKGMAASCACILIRQTP